LNYREIIGAWKKKTIQALSITRKRKKALTSLGNENGYGGKGGGLGANLEDFGRKSEESTKGVFGKIEDQERKKLKN